MDSDASKLIKETKKIFYEDQMNKPTQALVNEHVLQFLFVFITASHYRSQGHDGKGLSHFC